MRTETLTRLSGYSASGWTDIPDLDISNSWLDFGNVFDETSEGSREIIYGIFYRL